MEPWGLNWIFAGLILLTMMDVCKKEGLSKIIIHISSSYIWLQLCTFIDWQMMSFHCAAKLNEVWHVPVRFDKLGSGGLWRDKHEWFTEMSIAQIKKVWNLQHPHPCSRMCLLFIVKTVWPLSAWSSTKQDIYFQYMTPNFSKKKKKNEVTDVDRALYFLCSLKEKWLYCAYSCMTSSSTNVWHLHPSYYHGNT